MNLLKAILKDVPEEVRWTFLIATGFSLPWLFGLDSVAALMGGTLFLIWGGVIVLKMSTILHVNGVKLGENIILAMMCFSWLAVVALLVRFGRMAVCVRE